MNKEELTDFIKKNIEDDDFTGGANDKQIEYIQETLDIRLPKSYRWFLANHGSGGLFGVVILGVAKSNIATVVHTTKSYREIGMNHDLVVIDDIGEYAFCLDTSRMKNNECPVIAWNRQGGQDDYDTAANFYDFLLQRLLDAKEAWEEDF
ncbi:SMI1-KNR4 cell-wall [Bhargavaea ginsengi]|uniref:SMI1-KNR4 cell-wall n=1 Tax=Bhargavaea ginsengi TaxID=426757 RepID=A0A1H6YN42_9BACL|nr:SMI1/KNR4 family protein [Bhargavaea ginsengi]SEJ42723.1 SMI1-KNR4 cell-wall [Bhargavaea ginsengi]